MRFLGVVCWSCVFVGSVVFSPLGSAGECAFDLREFVYSLPHPDLVVEREARKFLGPGDLVTENKLLSSEDRKKTLELIRSGASRIFGAVFLSHQGLVRVDTIEKDSKTGRWILVNIRSGTKVKDTYLKETQDHFHVLRESELSIETAHLIHINPKARFEKPESWFKRVDVTDIVLGPDVEVSEGRAFYNGPRGKKAQRPPGAVGPGPFFDAKGLMKRMGKLKFPLYYLDFETLGEGLPPFSDSKPYQNIPFQLSLLRFQELGDSRPQKIGYLHPDNSDPRRRVAEVLVKSVPADGGTLLAYNANFEKKVLLDLAQLYPDLSDRLTELAARIEDPLEWTRSSVYHDHFNGSYSLKVVAPVLLGEEFSYADQVVSDGKFAQQAYRALLQFDPSSSEYAFIAKAMEDYCLQDTESLAELVQYLARNIGLL